MIWEEASHSLPSTTVHGTLQFTRDKGRYTMSQPYLTDIFPSSWMHVLAATAAVDNINVKSATIGGICHTALIGLLRRGRQGREMVQMYRCLRIGTGARIA